MSTRGMTTMEVKKINRSKVYHYIYENRRVCKQRISEDLQMGLSTITQNLKWLEEDHLIIRSGFYESTGGRKAYAIEINRTARIAIGVGILKEMVHLTAIDLYGNVLHSAAKILPFSFSPSYDLRLGEEVSTFIEENHLKKEQILGVSIAIQGIISTDGQSVSYGSILNHTGMKLSDLAAHIPFPCRLVHDSKAAAFLELWLHPSEKDMTVMLLNRNLGGAVIINGEVHNGTGMHSGALEHLCLNPEGPLCYCGQKGCLETYCSADSLSKNSNMDIESFFCKLRSGDSFCENIWQEYLNQLSFAIRNLTTLLDQKIILSGYLAPYFTQEDISFLENTAACASPFPMEEHFLLVSSHGQLAPAIGAALLYIHDFLCSI
ncbi:MAG: ROK family transcriptional regulator [Clostridiales bacterium]|nr:ROK family transcriptional regulator [Clostridiales bacterium]